MTGSRPPVAEPVSALQRWRDETIRYSICTLVTRPDEYRGMVASFVAGGFTPPACEYLYIDNSQGTTHDAFAGYNLFLTVARGEHIVLCHQDVLLLEDGRAELDARLAELTRLDPAWGACGNAGGVARHELAIRITDPHGTDTRRGLLPARVCSLDENFIVVRRDANLALSHDLSGFHWYGADLCILAEMLGRTAYVVDFHLRHKSGGTVDHGFEALQEQITRKYIAAMRPRWITTTVSEFFLAGSPLVHRVARTRFAKYIKGLL